MRSASVRAMLVLLVMVVMLNACDDTNQPDPSVVPVTAVRVTPQSVQLSTIGETRQLVGTIVPANATDQAISWESSDSNVVAVNATGLVTARAVGSGVFITAITHDGHHQASSNVTVNP